MHSLTDSECKLDSPDIAGTPARAGTAAVHRPDPGTCVTQVVVNPDLREGEATKRIRFT